MDAIKVQVPGEDHIDVTITDAGRISANIDVPTEIISVDITAVGETGDRGPRGDTGPRGPQGVPGDAVTAVAYTHYQMVPAQTWLINHNLNFNPGGITVQDAAGTSYEGEITYLDRNRIRIMFLAAFSGTAYLS